MFSETLSLLAVPEEVDRQINETSDEVKAICLL